LGYHLFESRSDPAARYVPYRSSSEDASFDKWKIQVDQKGHLLSHHSKMFGFIVAHALETGAEVATIEKQLSYFHPERHDALYVASQLLPMPQFRYPDPQQLTFPGYRHGQHVGLTAQ